MAAIERDGTNLGLIADWSAAPTLPTLRTWRIDVNAPSVRDKEGYPELLTRIDDLNRELDALQSLRSQASALGVDALGRQQLELASRIHATLVDAAGKFGSDCLRSMSAAFELCHALAYESQRLQGTNTETAGLKFDVEALARNAPDTPPRVEPLDAKFIAGVWGATNSKAPPEVRQQLRDFDAVMETLRRNTSQAQAAPALRATVEAGRALSAAIQVASSKTTDAAEIQKYRDADGRLKQVFMRLRALFR